MTKRYFVVFYAIGNPHKVGDITWVTDNGEYVNRKSVVRDLIKIHNAGSAALTSILELSETDYKDFIK